MGEKGDGRGCKEGDSGETGVEVRCDVGLEGGCGRGTRRAKSNERYVTKAKRGWVGKGDRKGRNTRRA